MSTNQDETKQQIFNVNEAKEEMTIKLREATENAVHIQMNRSTVTDETNALERTSTLNSTVNPILQGMKTNQETDKNLMGAEDYLSRKAEAKKNEAETENVINEKEFQFREVKDPFGKNHDSNSMNEDEFDSEENDDFAKDMKDKLSKYPIIGGLVNTYSNSGLKGCIDKINPFSEKLHFFGRVSIFVTGLRHGCGCTYITGSLATTMANELKEIICVCHRQGTNLPSMSRIKEYTGDTDFDRAYQGKVVIYDRGILGEFTQEEMIEMRRADIRLLVCNGEESDIQRLARFIHKAGDSAKDWMYVFNLVPNQWRMVKIRELMHDYNIIFIPLHDYTHIPVKVKKEWIKKINSAKKTS